jgi:hypothetical protein
LFLCQKWSRANCPKNNAANGVILDVVVLAMMTSSLCVCGVLKNKIGFVECVSLALSKWKFQRLFAVATVAFVTFVLLVALFFLYAQDAQVEKATNDNGAFDDVW